MGKHKAKMKQVVSRKEAVGVLKELIKGLESGLVAVGEGDGRMEFGVTDEVKVELKGRIKREKSKVSISLSWKQAAELPAEKPEAEVPATKPKAKTPAKKAKAKVPAKKASDKKSTEKKAPSKKAPAKKKPAKKDAAKKDSE